MHDIRETEARGQREIETLTHDSIVQIDRGVVDFVVLFHGVRVDEYGVGSGFRREQRNDVRIRQRSDVDGAKGALTKGMTGRKREGIDTAGGDVFVPEVPSRRVVRNHTVTLSDEYKVFTRARKHLRARVFAVISGDGVLDVLCRQEIVVVLHLYRGENENRFHVQTS